jgi:membrane-bound ClpP family serine protease
LAGVVSGIGALNGWTLVTTEVSRAVAQDGPIAAGEAVTVVGVDGLTLTVAKAASRR